MATVAYAAVYIVAGEHGYRRDIDYGVNAEQATAVIGPGLALLENMVGFRWFCARRRYSRSFVFAVDSETVGRLDCCGGVGLQGCHARCAGDLSS